MFGLGKKDPVEIAKELAKENDVVLDEKLTAESSESSPEDNQLDQNKDDKASPEDATLKDSKHEEDKDDQLTEEEQKLVDTDDSELDDDAKTSKQEIVKKKRNSGAEKRITELLAEVKQLKDDKLSTSERLDVLEAERQAMEKKEAPKDMESVLATQEVSRIEKYMSEDQTLPREQRREMSKEDIDEWIVDDYSEANDWLNRRYDRRKSDKAQDVRNTHMEAQATEIISKQNISKVRVEARHPELKTESLRSRAMELKGEGKSKEEAYTIMCEENPKYKAMQEVISNKEFAEEIAILPDGPERLEEAMLKQLAGKSEVKTDLEHRIAELEDQLKAAKLRGEPVGAGISSRSRGESNMRNEKRHNPELESELAKIRKKGFKMNLLLI